MRRLRDPVWRGSLVVLLRHYPAYAVAIAVGCAALALSALSGRTFVDAAEVALLQRQVDAVPPTAGADHQAVVRASMFDPTRPGVERLMQEQMSTLDGGTTPLEIRRPIRYQDSDLTLSPYAVNAAGDRVNAVLFDATGAIDALVPAEGSPAPAGTGVWVPDTVAASLGLGPGSPLGVALVAPGNEPVPQPTTVTGVYRTDGAGVPEDPTGLWAGLSQDLPPWPSHLAPVVPQLPLLVADTATYRALSDGIGEQSLVTWDVRPAADPVRIADAQELVDSTDALVAELGDFNSDLARQLSRGRRANHVDVASGLPAMVDAARTGYTATIQGVSADRVVGMGLSWLVLALSGVALLVRRSGERQMLVEDGRSVPELATLTVAEALLPMAVGLVGGWYAARPLVAEVVGTDGTPVRPQDTALVGAVVVLTLGLASAADAWARHRRTSGRAATAARRLPWRTVVVTLAAAGAVSAYAGSGDFDTTTAVLPIAAVAAVGVLASAALAAGLARLARRWQPRGLTARLTFSRLARDPGAATAFLAATIAFGAVGYGLLFQVSADRAADDKVAAAIGAGSVFAVSRTATNPQSLVGKGSTLVHTLVPRIDGTSGSRLTLVDPATFGQAALWSPRFADGASLEDALAPLRDGGDVVPLAVVGVADGVPTEGTLSRTGSFSVRYRVVEHLAAFPGMGDEQSLLVADARLLDRVSVAEFDVQLWSRYGAERAGADATDRSTLRLLGTAAEVRADPSLTARRWVTAYLQAFTVLALGLGLLVLVGLHRRDREQRLLQDVTLADLGHPRRVATRAAGRELAVVSLLGAATGGLAAYAVTLGLRGPLDPLPELPPALAVTGTTQLTLAGLAFVAAAGLITALSGRLGRTRSVNELLHDE